MLIWFAALLDYLSLLYWVDFSPEMAMLVLPTATIFAVMMMMCNKSERNYWASVNLIALLVVWCNVLSVGS